MAGTKTVAVVLAGAVMSRRKRPPWSFHAVSIWPRMLRLQCHEAVRFPERLELVVPINMAGLAGVSRYVHSCGSRPATGK